MKAAVYYGREDIRVEDVPEPVVRPGTVKVAVSWCGICGSDLHEFESGPAFAPRPGAPHPLTGETLPIILGHEFAGHVVEIGESVHGFAVGDRVSVEPLLYCGACNECRRGDKHLCRKRGAHGVSGGGGGMSERTVVPAHMLHKLPDGMSDEMGALIEPLAVGFHAVRSSGFVPGDTALVTGAGPIGLAALLALRASGARTLIVSEISAARQEFARRQGAFVVDPTTDDVRARVAELTGKVGVDFAFEAAGVPPSLATAISATRPAGTVVNLAVWKTSIELDPNKVFLSEQRLTGSSCYCGQDFPAVIAMVADGRIAAEDLVTAHVELADVVTGGFEELLAHRDEHVKILVGPGTS